MVQYLSQYNIILVGFLASLTAGLATSAGTLPIFFARDISKRVMDALLGTAAGIMLAATSFSLVIPAIDKAGGGARGAGIVLVGILAGGMFLDLIDKCFPNTNLMANSMPDTGTKSGLFDLHRPEMRKVWMFILAITVHNFPEGMAVGVGFGDGDISNGLSIAIAAAPGGLPKMEGFPGFDGNGAGRAHRRFARHRARKHCPAHAAVFAGVCRRGHAFRHCA